MGQARSQKQVESFDFAPGRRLAGKYEVISQLGTGWEGEVYKVLELNSKIERAAKVFYPHRNLRNRVSSWYARKLHKLRHCPMVIQYHTQELVTIRKNPVTVLVSEYVEGEILSNFLKRQPGKRLSVFQGLHLLYALARGIEKIHHLREYHGDLHAENIIVRRFGLSFDLKLLDMFHWGAPKPENIHDDVCDMVRIFYDSIGGRKYYSKLRPEARDICCGLKRSLILQKFRTAGQLREYLETMQWD